MNAEGEKRRMTYAETNEKFGKLIHEAIDCTNGGNAKVLAAEMVKALQTEHRTLQQAFLGVIKLTLHEYAKASFDLRNQAAVEWAKAVDALDNSDVRFPL